MIGVFWILLCGAVSLWGYLKYKSHLFKLEIEKEGLILNEGNVVQFFWNTFKGIHVTEGITKTYNNAKGKSRVKVGVGQFFGSKDYFVCDLDLARQIYVKDFDYFVDRRVGAGKNDNYVQKMLLALKGETWKGVRAKMSPTFTTGKIRRMFHTVNESGEKMVHFLEKELSSNQNENLDYIDLEVAYSKFTMDVVASVAFGIDAKTFATREKGIFENMGSEIQFKMDLRGLLKIFLGLTVPKVTELLGISLFSREAQEFFAGMVKSAIAQRDSIGGERRDDFLQLMMDVRKESTESKNEAEELETFEKEAQIKLKDEERRNVTLDEDDIVGQSILFLLAGYDTTMAAHLFCGHTLATHPEVQEKVYDEIQNVLEKTGGKLSYDVVMNEMPYLDMVINETMRLYPPGINAERVCTQNFLIPGTNYTIKKGEVVIIPIFAFHRDPEIFEDPLKFDPGRWDKDRKASTLRGYMTFGHGPRNCIGMRLAIMELKLAVIHVIKNYKLEPSANTPTPIKFSMTGLLRPNGLKLKMIKRRFE